MADLLERMVVTQVRYRVFESGHALLVRQALVAQDSGRHHAAGNDSGGSQMKARVRGGARKKARHVVDMMSSRQVVSVIEMYAALG